MATAIEQIRALTQIAATDISDADVLVFLDLNDDNVRIAAACACEAMASKLAQTAVSITTSEFSKDTRGRARDLLERAKTLRAEDSETPWSGTAERAWTDYQLETIIINEAIREENV